MRVRECTERNKVEREKERRERERRKKREIDVRKELRRLLDLSKEHA